MSDFEGRRVVVTGGGGFLGLAVVSEILQRGGEVHVPAATEGDSRRLRELGDPRVHVTDAVDLSDEAQAVAFFESVGELWASVHIAGGFVWGPLADAKTSDLDLLWNLNVRTCWLSCREAARRMGEGRIVNVAAKPALVPTPNLSTYAATKAAVVGLTLSLAEELRDRGIWVNAIAPSIFDTAVNRKAMPDADFDAWPSVQDIAETIAFLASPSNKSTRGAIVPVYGKS
ncbi:MAG: SDR family NAD(P)-dependent oxidoreductase [Myxococcota bacterium]